MDPAAEHPLPAGGPDPDLSRALPAVLNGSYAALRARTHEALCRLDLAAANCLDHNAYRDSVLVFTRELPATGDGARSDPTAQGGQDGPSGRVATFQTVGLSDLSLLVKRGVQFGLFGGSVHRLGTERHHSELLPAIGTAELPGCFAMSESGHGSDVRSIRTQTRYDVMAQEFVVHAFLVPIRDEDGQLFPGVEVGDCGDGCRASTTAGCTPTPWRVPQDGAARPVRHRGCRRDLQLPDQLPRSPLLHHDRRLGRGSDLHRGRRAAGGPQRPHDRGALG